MTTNDSQISHPPLPELVNADYISKWLKIPVDNVYRMARDRKLPSYKIGGRVRFSVQEIIEAVRLS